MPERYFLEHRVVHVTYPFSINGCTLATCPNGRDLKFLWYFKFGNCFFGFDLSNTAQMLWTATVETAAEASPLRLGNLAFKETRSEGEGLFQIYLDYPPGQRQQRPSSFTLTAGGLGRLSYRLM
eukprot:g19747.t1